MKKIVVITSLLFCSQVLADYNANIISKVTEVITYTHSTQIYFRLDNQPYSHPICKTDYFAIDASTPDNIRQQVLARLLTAYANGSPVNIGFDKEGDCSHGRIKVYRVG